MFYGESIGWANVLRQIREFSRGPFGQWWKLASSLETLAMALGSATDRPR